MTDRALHLVRPASADDAADIVRIYAPYIEDTAITFETEVPKIAEVRARIERNLPLGWLVHEGGDGKIDGYAYASRHRDRAAYQWCCEVSVYIDPTAHRRGVATLLYRALLDELKRKGFVHAYAGITLPNAASVSFHESFGFRRIATYEKIGWKLGEWRDVGWWDLRLNEPASDPAPPRLG